MEMRFQAMTSGSRMRMRIIQIAISASFMKTIQRLLFIWMELPRMNPYATYLTGTSKTETSTLSEVLARLGLDDSEDSSEDDSQETDTAPTPTSAPQQSKPYCCTYICTAAYKYPDNNGSNNTTG